jgi:hypothetical protein
MKGSVPFVGKKHDMSSNCETRTVGGQRRSDYTKKSSQECFTQKNLTTGTPTNE